MSWPYSNLCSSTISVCPHKDKKQCLKTPVFEGQGTERKEQQMKVKEELNDNSTELQPPPSHRHTGYHGDQAWLQISPWGGQGSGWDQRIRLSSFSIPSPLHQTFSWHTVPPHPTVSALISYSSKHSIIHSALHKGEAAACKPPQSLEVTTESRHAHTCEEMHAGGNVRVGVSELTLPFSARKHFTFEAVTRRPVGWH